MDNGTTRWDPRRRSTSLQNLGGLSYGRNEVVQMADVRRLAAPVTDVWDWQLRAACRGMDAGVFFHPEGERGRSRAGRVARAKRVCEGCPVRQPCLDHALAVREPYGVWGGLSAAERGYRWSAGTRRGA